VSVLYLRGGQECSGAWEGIEKERKGRDERKRKREGKRRGRTEKKSCPQKLFSGSAPKMSN